MAEGSDELLAAVRDIHELLRLIAEPAVAARDAKLRAQLRQIVGSSEAKKKSVYLMDGTRTQKQIRDTTSINQGYLSVLVKELHANSLLGADVKLPNLAIPLPPSFFDTDGDE